MNSPVPDLELGVSAGGLDALDDNRGVVTQDFPRANMNELRLTGPLR
ncbi:hypothetical protein [Pelagibacterium halotolerans]